MNFVASPATPWWRRAPALETLFVATIALLGLRLGLRPIGDNSMFVHMRTGIDIVDGLGIPRRDPYSFTAAGEPWVVQSWLASVVYGLLERAGGFDAVVLLHGALYGALGWLTATLGRTGSAIRTALVGVLVAGIAAPYWSPRPLAIGLVAFALTIAVVERNGPGWVLVPIAWVWVNTHGSFVLGALWLVLVALGGRREARGYLGWFAGGVLAGALNPLGPRLLLFPLALVDRRANFGRVVEWRPPSPRTPFFAVALVCLAAAVVLLAAGLWRRRLAPGVALPAVAFVALGLVSQRNLAPAAVVLAPALARVLGGHERDRSRHPHALARAAPVHWAFAGVLSVVALAFVGAALAGDALDVSEYPPRQALAAVSDAERVVSTDIAGGYRILVEGRSARVFVDDRYDMYPEQVIADYVRLIDHAGDPRVVLDRHGADAVIWPAKTKLAATLESDSGWRRVFRDAQWVVYLRGG